MAQTDRIARLSTYLKSGRCLSPRAMRDELGISAATLKRDIAYLRDRLHLPVDYDRAAGGYRHDPAAGWAGGQYELPGLWFSAEEVHALLTMQHLLSQLDVGGMLGPHIGPLSERLQKLLGSGGIQSAEIGRRIHIQTVGARKVHLPHFQTVGAGVLQRRRLVIAHHNRERDEVLDREVSPQRLVHYRDNWYLDAWCHGRRALRSFGVDALRSARLLDQPAIEVDPQELDAVLGAGYGIFAGRDVEWATLRFSPQRARWVAAETWHPKQAGHLEEDGRYVLRVPYADPRELVMDILRHVPEVEVLGPAALRDEVAERLREGLLRITP